MSKNENHQKQMFLKPLETQSRGKTLEMIIVLRMQNMAHFEDKIIIFVDKIHFEKSRTNIEKVNNFHAKSKNSLFQRSHFNQIWHCQTIAEVHRKAHAKDGAFTKQPRLQTIQTQKNQNFGPNVRYCFCKNDRCVVIIGFQKRQ